MSSPSRLITTRVLNAVVGHGQSLDEALQAQLQNARDADRPFIQAQCYGCLRQFENLEAALGLLLSKPLKPRDQDVFCLLVAGLYELWYMHTPAHACLSETVQVTLALNKAWAKGLVNAVLRRAQREQSALQQRLRQNEVSRYCLPRWLLKRIKKDWPQQWIEIAENLAQPAPMTLRVNQQQVQRDAYLELLAQSGIAARAHPAAASAIELDEARDVNELPGFAAGWVSVQDAAAQFAAPLLAPHPGDRVLDACAAPGGKTGHLAEQQPELRALWAVEIDERRLPRIRDNLQRLQLEAEVHRGDAAQPAGWWDGVPFDRILLDAPCSASGVIRRHPDIKRLRRESDIAALAARQSELLEAIWPLLAPGGMLLYATCSIIKAENTDCIARFVAGHGDARHQPLTLAAGMVCEYGHQILPGEQGMDGFFYAALLKQTA